MQKIAKRLSLVMVALLTVFTALSYMPAKAAVVVPKVGYVSSPKLEYTAGDRVQFNLNAPNYGGRVQYRVVLWDNNNKQMKDLWTTGDRYYTNWMPYGNETFTLGWPISEPGTYRITIYAKRAGVANSKTALTGQNCDSYMESAAFVVKAKNTAATISEIAPIIAEVNEGAVYALPTQVDAKMSDNTTKKVNVAWTPSTVDTTKVGEQKFAGKVEGYDKDVALTLNVKAVKLTAEVKAVGAKKLEVTFNKAVPANTVVTLKKGLVPYPVTIAWNEAKTVATLTYAYEFTSGDYTVTATGLETAATVTVAAPKVSNIELTDTYLPLKDDYKLGYKVYNQYGEEMTVSPATLAISVYNVTKASAISVVNPTTAPELDLVAAAAAKDNQVIVTMTHTATGVNASKVLVVNNAPAVAGMQFGTVAPLIDKTRISVSESGFVLPYTFVDQYGSDVKLSAHVANSDSVVADVETIDGIKFMTSNAAIVDPDTFAVDSNGKFTFNTGATAGTAIITAIVPSTGATAFFTVKVEAAAALKTISMNSPAELVVQSETVKVPYVATNSFDNVIATKDFTYGSSVTFVSSNDAIVNDATDIVFNSRTGELEVTPSGNGLVTVYAYIGGVLQNSIVLDVKALAVPTRVVGLVNVPTIFQNGASKTLTMENLNVIDQYNRAIDLGTYATNVYTVKVTAKDATADNVTIANADITASSVNTAIAGAAVGTVGTEELVFTLQKGGVDVTDSAYSVSAKTIAAADIKSYSLNEVPTIYGFDTNDQTSAYAKVLVLEGKDASGNAVTVDQSIITSITSSNLAVVGVNGTKIFALGKGTSVVTAWKGATKLAEVTVTASDVAPVASTVAFAKASYVKAAAGTLNLSTELTVKDQYGAVVASPAGTWASSNTTIATATAGAIAKTGTSTGTVTISFVTSNGIAATAEVEIQ